MLPFCYEIQTNFFSPGISSKEKKPVFNMKEKYATIRTSH